MTKKRPSLAALVLVAGCAQGMTQRQEADRRALAEARPVGELVDCIELSRIDHTRVRDNRTVDFYMRGRGVYRNSLPSECPGLAFEESFTYRTSLSRLCSVDVIAVNRNGGGIPGPTCALGPFQRIETPVR